MSSDKLKTGQKALNLLNQTPEALNIPEELVKTHIISLYPQSLMQKAWGRNLESEYLIGRQIFHEHAFLKHC